MIWQVHHTIIGRSYTSGRRRARRSRSVNTTPTRTANAVTKALSARGVPAERLRAIGLGGSRPIADNATRDGRWLNRRIEFRLEAAADADQRDASSAGTENLTTVSRGPGTPAS